MLSIHVWSKNPNLLKLMNLNENICLNGSEKALFDLDIDSLPEKPWREQGADISDWFNFGFDEESWTTYCQTQGALRHKLKALKKQHVTHPQPAVATAVHQIPQTHLPPHPAPYPQSTRLPPPPQPYAPQQQMIKNTSKMEVDSKIDQHQKVGICFDFQNKSSCLRGNQCRWIHQSKQNVAVNHNQSMMNAERRQMITNNLMNGRQAQNDKTTDQLQARLQVLLGTEAPNIPDVVSNLLHKDEDKKKKKKKRKKKKRTRSRSRSRSRSS